MAAKDVAASCSHLRCPQGISVSDSLPEGRGLLSNQKWLNGSEIMEVRPHCHVVSAKYHEQLCSNCLTALKSQVPLRCSGCKYNHYCSKSCQQQDWSVHKGECVGMATISPHHPTDTMRMVLRLMLKKKQYKKKSDIPWPVEFLCRSEENLSDSKKEAFAYQLTGVRKLCENNKHVQFENSPDLFSLLCRLSCNTFSILDVDMNAIGEGLYILPSLLNHSCQPNSTIVFDGLKMSVRTVQDLEPGQQLYISYVDLLEPLEKRQQILKDSYYFTCQCPRCLSVPSLDSLLTSVLCDKCGKVYLAEEVSESSSFDISLCSCGGSPDVLTGKLIEEFHHLSSEPKREQAMLAQYTSYWTRACKVLSPYHYVSIRTQEKIMDLAIDTCQWRVAFSVGRALTPLYKLFLEPSPLYTLHLVKLLKLTQMVEESGSQAVEIYHEVLTNLQLTHGSRHSLTLSIDLMTQSSSSSSSSQV